jgi:hypothetical protein
LAPEDSAGEDAAGEDAAGEDAGGEESAGEAAGGEDSDEESPPAPPQWAYPAGEVTEVDLEAGKRVALANLPAALRGALRGLEGTGGPDGLFLRCTEDLGVRIRYYQGQESTRLEVTIKHCALRGILQSGTLQAGEDSSEQAALHRALAYLAGRDWALPRRLYDHVGALPGPGEAKGPSGKGPFSEDHPEWIQKGADNQMGQALLATEITGALAEGFGLEKEEEVLLGL